MKDFLSEYQIEEITKLVKFILEKEILPFKYSNKKRVEEVEKSLKRSLPTLGKVQLNQVNQKPIWKENVCPCCLGTGKKSEYELFLSGGIGCSVCPNSATHVIMGVYLCNDCNLDDYKKKEDKNEQGIGIGRRKE